MSHEFDYSAAANQYQWNAPSTYGGAYSSGGYRNANFIVKLPSGGKAMIVVDPMTRKLTIPYEHILETRAQLRGSIPSLCQLFLAGRCRQGEMCHQVHADPAIIDILRQQVERLPICCVVHGDTDHTKGADDAREVVVEGLSWNGGAIPLNRLSYTAGLAKVMEMHERNSPNAKVMVASHNISICRLHVMDRCRFAEDCKFLHVCKEVVYSDQAFMQSLQYGSYTPPMTYHTPMFQHEAPPTFQQTMLPPSQSTNSLAESTNTPPESPNALTKSPSRNSSMDGSTWKHEPYMWMALPPPQQLAVKC